MSQSEGGASSAQEEDSEPESDSSLSESEFDMDQADGYDSADSRTRSNRVTLSRMAASLDTSAIVSLCLALTSKQYINENAVYKLQSEPSVDLFTRLLLAQ